MFNNKIAGTVIRNLAYSGVLPKFLNKVNAIGIHDKLIPGKVQRTALQRMQACDVLLIRPHLEMTNLFIGEGYTHSALKSYNLNSMIDSTGSYGVAERDVLEIFRGTKDFCIRRPKFTKEELQKAVGFAERLIEQKIEYDYGYALDKNSMYCSELVYHCLIHGQPGCLDLRTRYGFQTITPADLYKADRVFETIFEYRSVNNN